MAFHIEVSTGLNHARSFNLSVEEVRRTVVAPWIDKRPIELGDRKWLPEESELRILEGPELSNPELSFGNGWANAERRGELVTKRLLDEEVAERRSGRTGPAAIVIETDSAVRTLASLVSGQRSRSVDLDAVRARIDGEDPAVAAVILVVEKPA